MKNVISTTNKVTLIVSLLSLTACFDSSGLQVKQLKEIPSQSPTPVAGTTEAALNLAKSVTFVTCSNGTNGMRVELNDGSVSTVGCGGDVGPQGPQGAPGDAGTDGEQGQQGIAGPQGPQGIQGVAGSGAAKALKVYSADGIATGLIHVMTDSAATGYAYYFHEASNSTFIYGRHANTLSAEMIAVMNTVSSSAFYYTTTNCTGQAYMANGFPMGNAVFRASHDNKLYKTSGQASIYHDPRSQMINGNCQAVASIVAPMLAVNEVSLPSGVPTTIKQPAFFKYE